MLQERSYSASPNAIAVSGTYYIRGTTASGCSDIQPVVVTINAQPTVTITNPAAVCAPATVDITAAAITAGRTAGSDIHLLYGCSRNDCSGNTERNTCERNLLYQGTTASGCSDIQPVVVTINAQPTVIITNPAAVCAPATVDITAAAITAGSTAGSNLYLLYGCCRNDRTRNSERSSRKRNILHNRNHRRRMRISGDACGGHDQCASGSHDHLCRKSVLRNGNGYGNTNRPGRWNLHGTGRSCDQRGYRGYRSEHKYTWNIYGYVYIYERYM